MGKENFIPLSQVNNSNLCGGRLWVNLPLPYGLDERIGINTYRMDLLRQMAGFSRINLVGDDESGTSSVVPQIDGINRDGTAISHGMKVKTVPESSSEFRDNKKCSYNRANWPELTVKVNTGEIQQRLMEKKGVNINNPRPWSKSLDQVITNRIAKDGLKHLLLTTDNKYDRFFVPGVFYFSLLSSIYFWPGMSNPTTLILYKTEVDALGLSFRGFEKKDEGYRLSLTLGPEIERAIALSIYSRIGSVIRARAKEDKK